MTIRWSGEQGEIVEYFDIPEAYRKQADLFREHLIPVVAEVDPELEVKYIEGEEITAAELKRALRAATVSGQLAPVLCGAALRKKGVQPLLDAIVDYLPSPVDIPPIEGKNPKSGEVEIRRADVKEPFSALVFKVFSNPYVGHLSYLRCYSGRAKKGSTVLNATAGRRERIGRLLRMHANHAEDVDEITAGEILAAVGLKESTTGDTLCNPAHPIVLERIKFPEPVISMAVEAKRAADEDRLFESLKSLAAEDPTLRVSTDPDTGQHIISGMGELHLEVIGDRLAREFGVEANFGKPQVAYKETVLGVAEGEGRFIRQTGGRGQYGHVPRGCGGGDAGRRAGRLSGHRREGNGHRWLVARSRFHRCSVQDRRNHGVQGCLCEGGSGATGADYAGGSGNSGRPDGGRGQ